jgi:hypothetical protein
VTAKIKLVFLDYDIKLISFSNKIGNKMGFFSEIVWGILEFYSGYQSQVVVQFFLGNLL